MCRSTGRAPQAARTVSPSPPRDAPAATLHASQPPRPQLQGEGTRPRPAGTGPNAGGAAFHRGSKPRPGAKPETLSGPNPGEGDVRSG